MDTFPAGVSRPSGADQRRGASGCSYCGLPDFGGHDCHAHLLPDARGYLFFPLFRSAAFPFFGGSLPAVLGLAVLAAFAFSPSIRLIRAACLAFALVEGAYYLPRQWRAVAGTYAAWNQIFDPTVQYYKFFTDMIATAIWTFAWVSLVGFMIAFAATQPRFGENRHRFRTSSVQAFRRPLRATRKLHKPTERAESARSQERRPKSPTD